MSVRSLMYASTLGYLTVAGGLLAGQETDKPFYVMNHTLVVAKVTETTRFLAYSRTVGEWNEFTFPEDVARTRRRTGRQTRKRGWRENGRHCGQASRRRYSREAA